MKKKDVKKTNLFSIGEVAHLFHLSVSSLRHYEDVGILAPEEIDPETNYRYYSTRQFEVLNTIRYLRVLDMPLGEIADFLQNRDVDHIEEKLLHQKEAVIQKQLELKRIEKKIDHRLHQLQDARTSILDTVQVVQIPQSRIILMENSLKIHSFLDMEAPIRELIQADAEAVVFLGKVGVGISAAHLEKSCFDRYDSIFLILDEEDHYSGDTMILPETSCARIRFCGSHSEAPAKYRKLLQYIRKHHLKIDGPSREITLIDYGITNDTDKFVTEISIPVISSSR